MLGVRSKTEMALKGGFMNSKEECLRKACEIVNGARARDYGSPEDGFTTIAILWETYLEAKTGRSVNIDALDVAMMMELLKIARAANSPLKDDNYIDLAGYAACAYSIAKDAQDAQGAKEGINVQFVFRD